MHKQVPSTLDHENVRAWPRGERTPLESGHQCNVIRSAKNCACHRTAVTIFRPNVNKTDVRYVGRYVSFGSLSFWRYEGVLGDMLDLFQRTGVVVTSDKFAFTCVSSVQSVLAKLAKPLQANILRPHAHASVIIINPSPSPIP